MMIMVLGLLLSHATMDVSVIILDSLSQIYDVVSPPHPSLDNLIP